MDIFRYFRQQRAERDVMADYYRTNHLPYHLRTCHLNPASFLTPLVNVLPPGSTVLDVGCGSGRDLLWLKQRGYRVTGLERAVLGSMSKALHPGGWILITLKEGRGRLRGEDGRVFYLWRHGELSSVFGQLGLVETAHFSQPSITGAADTWLTYLLKRPTVS